MAQVILIYPVTGLDLKGVSVWLPLAVLQVAATIYRDYDTVIIDQRLDDHWEETLKQALTEETLCVGISSMTGTQIRFGLKAAHVVRSVDPEVPIVWGGNHPTLVVDQTVLHPLVDIVVMGEGEQTFRRLVETFETGGDVKTCPSIALKDGTGGVQRNGNGFDFVNPDTVPELPYHLVDVEQYIGSKLLLGRRARSLPFITSSGCPYACTFCCQPVLSNRRWRKMSTQVAIERVMKLVETYKLDAIEFHDEEFFVNRKRGAEIAELIGGRFQWYVQTRMDDLLAMDLPRLERNGLRCVQPGLETGSPRILKMIKKQETVEQYRQANKALAKTGIQAIYNFMMGFPTETYDDLMGSVDLSLELLDANPQAHVAGFYVYVPYPGAELYQQAMTAGFQPPMTLEGWSIFNRQHLDSPWIQDRLNVLENILMTSKLVDGSRLMNAFADRVLIRETIRLLGKFYRWQWRRHRFSATPDVKLLRTVAKNLFGW